MRLVLVLLTLAGAAVLVAPRLAPEPIRAPVTDARERVEREVRGAEDRDRDRDRPPALRCPSAAGPDCRAVRGRVVLVESVDPDGDGDLHVVVADGSITLPGATAVDVPAALRPERDPRLGDTVSAAGPVQRGSRGQAQIHALRFRTR